jgi:hypothetical protein
LQAGGLEAGGLEAGGLEAGWQPNLNVREPYRSHPFPAASLDGSPTTAPRKNEVVVLK